MNDENYGTIISNEVITQSQDTSSDIAHINSDTTNLFNYTTTGYLLDNSGAIEAPVQLGYSLINSQPHLVYTMYFQQNGMSNSNLKYPVYTINSVQQELSRSDLSADIPQMLNIKQDTAFQLEGNPAIAPLQLIADHAATTFQYREFPSPLNCTAKEAFMQEQSFDLGTFCELQGFSQNQQIIQQQNETSTINPCEISAVDKENNNNSSEDASDDKIERKKLRNRLASRKCRARFKQKLYDSQKIAECKTRECVLLRSLLKKMCPGIDVDSMIPSSTGFINM